MRPSRGMGDINPSKMPGAKKKERRDDTDFTEYKKGGEVWNKSRPKSLGKPKKLTPEKKSKAKAMARAGGRPYPNLIDNMRASKK